MTEDMLSKHQKEFEVKGGKCPYMEGQDTCGYYRKYFRDEGTFEVFKSRQLAETCRNDYYWPVCAFRAEKISHDEYRQLMEKRNR